MKALFKALAGVVIAASTSLAAAQPIVLNFNDLPSGGGYFVNPPLSNSYMGFNFSSATGTENSSWMWADGSAPYRSGAGPDGNPNATGFLNLRISDPVPPSTQYDAFVISSATPFIFNSALFSGCCSAIWVSGTKADGSGEVGIGGWTVGADNFLNPLTATVLVNPLTTQLVTNFDNTPFSELVIWAPSGYFAIDDINVTMVPEPSSYAMMIAGLGALGFVARRRKAKASAA